MLYLKKFVTGLFLTLLFCYACALMLWVGDSLIEGQMGSVENLKQGFCASFIAGGLFGTLIGVTNASNSIKS